MRSTSIDACTYIGILDDSVSRYPWQFAVNRESLNHLLAVELIHGKPILLNDGYLVNNELARAALLASDGLLWELIQQGFVRVMSRGGSQFGLDELPIRMSSTIPSFEAIVHNKVPGVQWTELQRKLLQLDGRLRAENHLVDWPRYDAGSGFLALAENMAARGASPHSLGIGKHIGRKTFHSFLTEVVDSLSVTTAAPRTQWENLARRYAGDPKHTNAPALFMRALMNLANELYHYNMGVLLSAEHGVSVSVQTQTSPAFDDLLMPPSLRFLVSELPNLPRLNVPAAVAQADPIRLARILVPDNPVFESRARWLQLREDWERALPERRPHIDPTLRQAGQEYAARLSEYLGSHVKFKESEELIDYVVGNWASTAATAGTASALALAGADPTLVIGGTFAVGYAVTRAKNKLLGNVFRKFRVVALDKALTLPRGLAEASARAMHTIRRRRVPSTIQITPSLTATVLPRLKRFGS
jgi:hypothetical protein